MVARTQVETAQMQALKAVALLLAAILCFDVMSILVRLLSARYAPPELLLRQRASGRTAVFSLGVLFYELLLGARPFESIDEVIEAGSVPLDKDALLKELGTPGSKAWRTFSISISTESR